MLQRLVDLFSFPLEPFLLDFLLYRPNYQILVADHFGGTFTDNVG